MNQISRTTTIKYLKFLVDLPRSRSLSSNYQLLHHNPNISLNPTFRGNGNQRPRSEKNGLKVQILLPNSGGDRGAHRSHQPTLLAPASEWSRKLPSLGALAPFSEPYYHHIPWSSLSILMFFNGIFHNQKSP